MAIFFNSNLKFLREKNNMSRTELAKKLNVHQSTVSRWENGEMGATVDNAVDISKVLNIPLPDLIGRDLRLSENNSYDNKIKELETETGIKISYSTEKELTQEDYLAINELVLNEIKSQKEEDKK